MMWIIMEYSLVVNNIGETEDYTQIGNQTCIFNWRLLQCSNCHFCCDLDSIFLQVIETFYIIRELCPMISSLLLSSKPYIKNLDLYFFSDNKEIGSGGKRNNPEPQSLVLTLSYSPHVWLPSCGNSLRTAPTLIFIWKGSGVGRTVGAVTRTVLSCPQKKSIP